MGAGLEGPAMTDGQTWSSPPTAGQHWSFIKIIPATIETLKQRRKTIGKSSVAMCFGQDARWFVPQVYGRHPAHPGRLDGDREQTHFSCWWTAASRCGIGMTYDEEAGGDVCGSVAVSVELQWRAAAP